LNKRMSWGRTVVCRFDDAHRLSSLEQREKKEKEGSEREICPSRRFPSKICEGGRGFRAN
jgi:hypothetical protein